MPDIESTAVVLGVTGLSLIALTVYGMIIWIILEAIASGSIPLMLFSVCLAGFALFATAMAIDPRGAY